MSTYAAKLIQVLALSDHSVPTAYAAMEQQPIATVALRGNGAAFIFPEIDVSTTSVNFGSVNVGTVATQTVTISNIGSGPLVFTGLNLASLTNFNLINLGSGSCSLINALAANQSCTITLTFQPTLLGSLSTTLTILNTDLDEAVKVINLSGLGVSPEIEVSATTVNFGSVGVGEVATQTVTISNTGSGSLVFTGLSLGSLTNFSLINLGSGSCSLINALAAGQHCTLTLTFHPTGLGSLSTTLTILNTDLDEAVKVVNLNGLGISPEIEVSATTVNFGSVGVGEVATQTVTISNTGSGPLIFTGLSLGSLTNFDLINLGSGSCSLINALAAGQSCTLTLTFEPTLLGSLSTVLTIASTDLDELITLVNLNGLGISPEIEVSTTAIDFGSVDVGEVATRTVTISNTGSGPLVFAGISLDSLTNFGLGSGGCGLIGTLAAGESCTITLTFEPTLAGALAATLTILNNDLDEAIQIIGLDGIGAALLYPEIDISVSEVDFGSVQVGGVATRTLTISNTGDAPLLVTSIAISGTDALEFTAIGGSCSLLLTTLLPGENCYVLLTFHPITEGDKEAGLVILSNDITEPTARLMLWGDSEVDTAMLLTIQIDTPIEGDNVVNRREAGSVEIRGQTQASAQVTVTISDGDTAPIIVSTTAGPDGRYQVTADVRTLQEGSVTVLAQATDSVGTRSAPALQSIQKDTIVLPPVMVGPANGSVALTQTPVISGTGEVGGVVTIFLSNQTLTSTVDATGVWQVRSDELADSSYIARLKITDAAGNSTEFVDGNLFTVSADHRAEVDLLNKVVYLPLIHQ
ncbi:MAG: choice-of-anchor D domain-containing protein [Caldilineaceae bacterium]|nr:choice-of-anchor D domain-containing protein [Caldilineaceae bacterium]